MGKKEIKVARRKKLLYFLIILCVLTITLFTGCSSPQTPADLYAEDMKSFYTETTYGMLEFPERWEPYVSCKRINEDNTEIVQYWVKIENYDEVHIFDIVFGQDGYYVGTIENDNGKSVDVRVISYEAQLGDEWIDEDANTVYAIAEDINYLLVKLNNIQGFKAA